MRAFEPISIVLVATTLASLFYKMYLQNMIRSKGKGYSVLSFLLLFVSALYLIPMSVSTTDRKENRLRKRANWALVVFYLSFILTMVLSAIERRYGNA